MAIGLVLLLSACADDPTDADKFIGTWSVTAGFGMVVCGTSMQSVAEAGIIELAAGTDSDLVEPSDGSPPCDVNYNATANVATVVPGQQCSGTVSSGATVVSTFDVATYTLAADDTLTLEASGTATSTPAGGGTPVACTYTRNATYRRK